MLDIDDPAAPEEKDDDEIAEAPEYSASGWFKWKLKDPARKQDCHLIFRLAK